MGGAELHIKEFSERLLARGHTVSVLAMNSRCLPIQGSERSTSSEVINGVHVHRLNNAYALHNRLFNIRGAHRVMRTLLTAEAMEVSRRARSACGRCCLRCERAPMSWRS